MTASASHIGMRGPAPEMREPGRTALMLSPAVLFYAVFFGTPMLSLFVLSFWRAEGFNIVPAFTAENYLKIFASGLYRDIILRTIGVGLLTAAITVPVGFTLSYLMRFVFQQRAQMILQLVLVSLFSGYLVRIYAWRTILGKQGLLNSALHWLGLTDGPLDFLIYSNFAVIVTLTGLLLPLAVLPIYSSMANISRDHIEIATDLGSRRLHLIRTVLVPMALPGIRSAFAFTFLLAAGDFVTPSLVGGSRSIMIGNVVADQFRGTGANWPLGAALAFVETLGLPVVSNGMGRGIVPGGHPCCVTRARKPAFSGCDLALVIGTPLDFRIGYGAFGPYDAPAAVVHLADSPEQVATHRPLAASAAGDLSTILTTLGDLVGHPGRWGEWVNGLSEASRAAYLGDGDILAAQRDPIHPARIYGELLPRLSDDTIVIGDGGDFVSWAGRFIHPKRPGRWLDPGPFGCLGAGLGAAIGARVADPDSPIVLLLGDGAAGMSLMDVDTLVRHKLPVVMVVGNNGMWGLEKHPMQLMFGYDVAAELAPQTRYDEVVRGLGGAGEMVTRPGDLRAALQRGFDSGVPYLVNVVTDPAVAYPRSTTGI